MSLIETTPSPRALRVAIAGLGRSGWNIHAKALRGMPSFFRVTAAMDPCPGRRAQAEAELGARTCEDFDALLASDVDVVVIASPSQLHADQTLAAAAAGKHIVVEKPFAMSTEEADQMIAAAEAAEVVLAPFQNRRYEPHFRKVLEIIQSGSLGDVIQVRMCWHRFTRRWDWQALARLGGGALFNNGTHLLDQALEIFGDAEPEIFVETHRGLSMGDAHEHLKLLLRAPGAPTIDLEYTNACAFEHDRWHVMGTAGGLRGDLDHLEWKKVDWSRMPDRVINAGPAADRLYPGEEIEWQHRTWTAPKNSSTPYELFYRDLYGAITNSGRLLVTPASARRYVNVLERCLEALETHAGISG